MTTKTAQYKWEAGDTEMKAIVTAEVAVDNATTVTYRLFEGDAEIALHYTAPTVSYAGVPADEFDLDATIDEAVYRHFSRDWQRCGY